MIRAQRSLLILLACIFIISAASICEAQEIPASTYQELRWRNIGPFRGGRTRALAGVPSQPNVFYIGPTDGGVWKSDDYGRTWNPIFDAQDTQSIGAIAVAPSDPSIIYVASGEGLRRPDLSVGDEIYKSTDAGKTWTHLGLRNGQQIPALVVDPHDPNRLFAAVLGHPYGPNAERGIFRSTDGGKTWTRVLYKDENTGGSDIEMDPSNPNVLYASLWESRVAPWEDANMYGGKNSGLFKSTDGGDTWHPLTNGLPKDLLQINTAIAASQPSRLFAVVGTTEKGAYASGKGLGIFRSDDAGENWHRVTTDQRPAMRIGGGDLPILRVDPKNPEVVYSTSIVTLRSLDGGKTWTSIRGAPGGDDYQNIWINPNDPDIILLVADQGALVSVNRGQTWSSWYNQPTAQLYHASVTNTFPYKVCGGQQESGSVCISSRGNDGSVTERDWHPVGAIEYGYVAPDPLDPNIIYGGGRSEVSKYHWDTGQVQDVTPIPIKGEKFRAERTQPTMFSPLDPHALYYTTNFLFKTTDGGEHWETTSPDLARPHPGIPASVGNLAEKDPKAEKQGGAIYALAPSFKSINTLWAGTDDGLIWITRDGGKNWKDITPPDLTPWSKVTQLDASHFDDDTVYASVSRFRIDDLRPYIYRTHDGGKSWQKITTGLPDAPVNAVREDPVRKGLLFAGTESSIWVSFDDGDHWQSLQLNLPHTSMRDLWIHDDDLVLATHGRSFWILDDITPLRQIDKSTADTAVLIFKPDVAYRVRRSTYTDTPIPPDEPLGKNPPAGAILDYFLGRKATCAVYLDVFDAHDVFVRRYFTGSKPDVTLEELEKQHIPLYWIRMPKVLPSEPGMHRWVWDLHYPAPVSVRHEFPISAVPGDTPRVPQGPRVLPGEYHIRVIAVYDKTSPSGGAATESASGMIKSTTLTIKMDPRVKASSADLEAMFRLQTRLAGLMTYSSTAILQARSAREQLEKLGTQPSAASDAIKALDKKLEAILEGAGETDAGKTPEKALKDVNGDVYSLYMAVDRADAAPTPAQQKAAAEIENDLAPVSKRWEEIKSTDIPALNRQLKGANLTEIQLAAIPQMEEEAGEDLE
ncbi:MAG: WD40/YVTN/BNR-like repeat-containing protein [Candidatus Acidiferrales bacterium]